MDDATKPGAALTPAWAFVGPDAALMVTATGGRRAAGGPGRRRRAAAVDRCASEARAASGSCTVHIEQPPTGARHIEVQIEGNGRDAVSPGDPDCSVRRCRQKLIAIAPAPARTPALREARASSFYAATSPSGDAPSGCNTHLGRLEAPDE